jgi:hypothetical protein
MKNPQKPEISRKQLISPSYYAFHQNVYPPPTAESCSQHYTNTVNQFQYTIIQYLMKLVKATTECLSGKLIRDFSIKQTSSHLMQLKTSELK